MNCIHAHSPVQGLFCFWALHSHDARHTIARAGLSTQPPHSRRIKHPQVAPNKGDSLPESLTTGVYHAGGRWRASGRATWFRGHGSGAKENAPGALSFVGAALRLPDPPLLSINKGESIMAITNQTTHSLPSFADYQSPDTDTDMLPFVQCSPDRMQWHHWKISPPAQHEDQEDYGYRLGAHLVQYLISNQGGQHNSLLRNVAASMSKTYSETPNTGHFGGDNWPVVVAFFEFIEKMLAAHISADMDVLTMAEEYIQSLADEREAEEEDSVEPRPLPYMIRQVTTNTPEWWRGELPVIEYEAARWAVGGNIERKQFKTLDEAEAWTKRGVHHG